MTRQKNLKALIRARMARTQESYTTARRQVLRARGEPQTATATPRGVHPDSAALAQVFAANGLPHDEALLFGLGGGVGFLCFVFDYAGHPPLLTAVMRRWSMSDVFGEHAARRAGVGARLHRTGGARAAAKTLAAALASGRAFACAADIALLPHHGLPLIWKGTSPQLVGVFGADEHGLEIEDHGRRLLAAETIAAARGGHRKSKHLLIEVEGPVDAAALDAGLRAALTDCAAGLLDPQMGHFQNNFGVRGIRTLATQLTDARTQKGLARRFDAHRPRLLGRLYEGVRQDWSGPGGLRGLYADFLAQAQARLGISLPVEAFREAGRRWEAFATAALAGHERLLALREAIDARVDAVWAGAGTAEVTAARAAVEAAMQVDLGWDAARWQAHLAGLAERLGPLADLEAEAAAALRAAAR